MRDPLGADAVAAGAAPDDDTTRTLIAYQAGRVASVTLPVPNAGSISPAPRPAHSYEYASATETRVHVAGLAEPSGFARKVSFDDRGRTVADTDATGRTTETTWDAGDRPTSVTDPAGRRTTTLYDRAGRPTEAFGPAPAPCFGTDRRPNGSCAPMPHSSAAYDGGITGLAAAYWPNKDLAGPPKLHQSVPALDLSWAAAPGPDIPADYFSARFTGEIALPEAGTYSSRLNADNGVRLWIDDRLVTDEWNGNWGWRPPASFANTGTANPHRILVELYDDTGPAAIQLSWTTPSGVTQVVPAARLAPRYGLATRSTVEDSGGPPTQVTATTIRPSRERPAHPGDPGPRWRGAGDRHHL